MRTYSFPSDIQVLGLVAHRLRNLITGKEDNIVEVTQENFSIPDCYSPELATMIKSWLAPKPVDRPVLAGIILDPLFREFITLTPYNERKENLKASGVL